MNLSVQNERERKREGTGQPGVDSMKKHSNMVTAKNVYGDCMSCYSRAKNMFVISFLGTRILCNSDFFIYFL